VRRTLATIALVGVLGGCSSTYDEDRGPYRPPGIARVDQPVAGEQLYLRDCAWCHGDRGEGTDRGPNVTTGTNGPAMNDFMLSTGRMPIEHARAKVVHRTPSYSREQIDAIVDYMRAFDAPGPEIPEVDLEGDLAHGLTLYQENCAACHSTTGIGGALTPGRELDAEGVLAGRTSLVAPSLHGLTATEIAEATRVGPGTMPVFGEETISDEDLSAITRYVLYLQDPADPGGAPVGRVGPVVEGGIGWIVGLGLLVIFIRWIGTKRGES
jgi:ubiquinol-cytochrome c reductase cytochrome c subunit